MYMESFKMPIQVDKLFCHVMTDRLATGGIHQLTVSDLKQARCDDSLFRQLIIYEVVYPWYKAWFMRRVFSRTQQRTLH